MKVAVICMLLLAAASLLDAKQRTRKPKRKPKNGLQDDDVVIKVPLVEIEDRLNKLEGKLKAFEEATKISFTACTTAIRSYVVSQKYIFENAVHNYGNNYNTGSSEFTCPIKGIYQFEIHLLSAAGFSVTARIIKTGWPNGRGEAFATNKATWLQASNSIITQCNPGEKVWVRAGPFAASAPNRVYGDTQPDRCISTFSGKLLAVLD